MIGEINQVVVRLYLLVETAGNTCADGNMLIAPECFELVIPYRGSQALSLDLCTGF